MLNLARILPTIFRASISQNYFCVDVFLTEATDYNETIKIFMGEFLTPFNIELGRILSPPPHPLLFLFAEKYQLKALNTVTFNKKLISTNHNLILD